MTKTPGVGTIFLVAGSDPGGENMNEEVACRKGSPTQKPLRFAHAVVLPTRRRDRSGRAVGKNRPEGHGDEAFPK